MSSSKLPILNTDLKTSLQFCRSVAFVEDLPLPEHKPGAENATNPDALYDDIERAYEKCANNCLVAAMLYGITLAVSLHQRWLNQRPTPMGYNRYT